MFEENKQVVRNRKILSGLGFLSGLLLIFIWMIEFHVMYFALLGVIISMLSIFFYSISELEWRFTKATENFKF